MIHKYGYTKQTFKFIKPQFVYQQDRKKQFCNYFDCQILITKITACIALICCFYIILNLFNFLHFWTNQYDVHMYICTILCETASTGIPYTASIWCKGHLYMHCNCIYMSIHVSFRYHLHECLINSTLRLSLNCSLSRH